MRKVHPQNLPLLLLLYMSLQRTLTSLRSCQLICKERRRMHPKRCSYYCTLQRGLLNAPTRLPHQEPPLRSLRWTYGAFLPSWWKVNSTSSSTTLKHFSTYGRMRHLACCADLMWTPAWRSLACCIRKIMDSKRGLVTAPLGW